MEHYSQVVEELLKDNEIHLKIINQDEKGNREEQVVRGELRGTSYSSRVAGSYIDPSGKKKTVIEIVNDKDQILGNFELENQEEEQEHLFDGQSMSKIR